MAALSTVAPARVGAQGLESWTEGQLRFHLRSYPVVEERYTTIGEAVLLQALKFGPGKSEPRLIGFVRIDGKIDDEKFHWNNRHRVALGVGLEFPVGDWGVIAGGLRHEWEWRRLSGENFKGWMPYVNWAGWSHRPLNVDWGASSFTPALRATTWGEARAPNAHMEEERTTALAEGAFELGVDIAQPIPAAILNIFSELEYETDTRRLAHNNNLRPAFGAKLLFEGRRGTVQIGAKAVTEFQFVAGERRSYGELFVIGSVRW